jgi:hypothetical protein
MDCRRAQDALGALRDGCESSAATVAAVEHSASCPECAAFSSALAALAAMPSPKAPHDLAKRISLAIAAEADSLGDGATSGVVVADETGPTTQAATVPAATTGDGRSSSQVPALPPWLTRARLWAATGTVAIAAAGIVVAVIVSGRAIDGTVSSTTMQESARAGAADKGSAPSMSAPAPVAPTAPVRVPDYVAYETSAYTAGARVDPLPSAAATVGTIQTALGSRTVRTLTVLRVAGDAQDIILALPDGSYQTFTLVTRSIGDRVFRLHSGPALDRFGAWPTLPQGYAQPPSGGGSPYYRAAGTDSLDVPVYVRVGQTPDFGFGIAPGTPATDPAAGNPNWTWWSPLR